VSSSDNISLTAHYTSEVWLRNGLSHPGLATRQGSAMFEALRPVMRISHALDSPTLESYLLARHRAIDAALERAIEQCAVTQVVEVAAGLSPRGWRFVTRYGDRLAYLEGDLPAMAARKRRALDQIGSLGERHRVLDLDALRDDGPASIPSLAGQLDPGRGTAIITEGLLPYLSTDALRGLWRRFARALAGFPTGVYISDLHLRSAEDVTVRAFRVALSAFVRSRVYVHFDDAAEAEAELRASGFRSASVLPAWRIAGAVADTAGRAGDSGSGDQLERGATLAHILEASTE
jgi:O-methyltransferase involved in polyketide biosynthesis